MRIAKLSESAYEAAEGPLREFIDAAVDELRRQKTWKLRQQVLFDIIEMIELGFNAEGSEDLDDEEFLESLGPEGRERLERALPTLQRLVEEVEEPPVVDLRPVGGEAAEADEDDGDEGDDDGEDDEDEDDLEFLDLLPFVVGAVLEQLNEDRLTSSEQTAFYALSCHTEHLAAAQGWLEADPKNTAAFRKFVKSKPRYAELLVMLNAARDEEDGEDPAGGHDGQEPP